jgi:1-acyl-sn-glycerol-3-phosphate acyltransferase
MKHLRAILRLGGLITWAATLLAVYFPLRLVLSAWDGAVRQLKSSTFRIWAKGTAWISGMHVIREGHPPKPPFVLVSNHLSYMDIVLLATQVNALFVAKAEVDRWPIIGFCARRVNTIFVERGSRGDLPRVLHLMQEALHAGSGVVFFPEGTSSDGSEVMRFKSSLFDVPMKLGYPVHAAAISYETPPEWPAAKSSVCWWGDMTFPDHLYRLLQLPGFHARVVFGEGVPHREDRRAFADALRVAVKKGFAPAQRARG